jgi:nickel/cobalt transporter (NicO) family protein
VTRRFGATWTRHCLVALAVAAIALAAIGCGDALAQISPLDAMRGQHASGFLGWIAARQSLFYLELSGLIRAAKSDGSAYWGLMGVSFVYGIFHAAGPGHGKAVISSYLLANEETWRRGVALSFASALLQAMTAVALVTVAAVLIGATAKVMGDAVRVIELVSYTLIVLVGARLLWVKGRALIRTWHTLRSGAGPKEAACRVERTSDDSHHCDHHDHGHHHDHDHEHGHAHDRHEAAHAHQHAHEHDTEEGVLPWGHAHGPEPEELAGPGGWRRGLSAIVAVGLRPCSGAIIVLVFALAQGLFLAGVASTFVMGLGTAMTVSAIASLAVGAKTVARQLAVTRAGYGTLALRGVEVGAALVVMLFGLLLLTGTIASERMGMF